MSVLDQLKKLDEQRTQLLEGAKNEALAAGQAAIKTLNELGFSYRLTQEGSTTVSRATGTRRTGIRDQVLDTVKATDGITRADLLETMGAKGNKSAEQSISNALAALKKAGTITQDGGRYKA